MVDRSVNVKDLNKFDFFNDATDTIRWLQASGRIAEAEVLTESHAGWLTRRKPMISSR